MQICGPGTRKKRGKSEYSGYIDTYYCVTNSGQWLGTLFLRQHQ